MATTFFVEAIVEGCVEVDADKVSTLIQTTVTADTEEEAIEQLWKMIPEKTQRLHARVKQEELNCETLRSHNFYQRRPQLFFHVDGLVLGDMKTVRGGIASIDEELLSMEEFEFEDGGKLVRLGAVLEADDRDDAVEKTKALFPLHSKWEGILLVEELTFDSREIIGRRLLEHLGDILEANEAEMEDSIIV